MKKFFSFMKGVVSGSEENETTDDQCCAPSTDGDETAMTIAQEENEEETSAAAKPSTPDSSEMEQVDQEEPPSNVESEGHELEASSSKEDPMRDPIAIDNSVTDPAPGEVVSPRGDAHDDGAITGCSVVAASTEDQRTISSEVDTCSWEPKTKDVKVALTEKGDNNVTNSNETTVWSAKHTKPEVIHPLQNSWGIWCFMQNRCQDWHENVRHISNFSSVEDFWSLFNHIQTVDHLPVGCDYYIFKANIQPMWEDRANVNGGRWLLKIPQSQPNFVHLWIETLLLLVGEAFESESDSICGAVAQVRRGLNKISIWTREAGDRNACMRIGYRWKSCIKSAAPIHYEAHMEVNRKGSRRSKSVYAIN